jgi:hypothetical protein
MTDALYEQATLWPIRLVLPTKQGLTLWGTGGAPDGVDRLLVVDSTLVLLASEFALRAFVANDHTSSLARLPGYDALRRAWQPPAGTPLSASTIDLVAVSLVLSQPVDSWTLEDCDEVLTGLNMLFDIANALGDATMRERFHTGVYRDLLDRLTFIEADKIGPTLAGIDTRAIITVLLGDLTRVDHATMLLGEPSPPRPDGDGAG